MATPYTLKPGLIRRINLILDVQFADQRSAWDIDSEGNHTQRTPAEENAKGTQETLIGMAEKRLAAAGKHKEKKMRAAAQPLPVACQGG